MRTQEAVSAMLCPVCHTRLSMSDRSGVEIDFCPSCRGVWLDRGELDKIIERSTAPVALDKEPQRGSDRRGGGSGFMGMASSLLKGDDDRYGDRRRDDRYDDDDRYDKRRRKQSIFSEFFD